MKKNMDQFSFDMDNGPPNIPRLKLRAMDLSLVDQEVTEANTHYGATVMDPDYAAELNLHQKRNEAAFNRRMGKASTHLTQACGKCAIEGCEKRDNIQRWVQAYPYAAPRHRHINKTKKDAEKGIERAC